MKPRLLKFWRNLGPGIITGASDDDPSGIATYSAAGARFGTSLLWTALFSYPLMAGIQEMCARIGVITGRGLAGNIKSYYPKWILYIIIFISFPSIIFNIGADIAAMGAVSNMLFPAIHASVYSIAFTALLVISVVYLSYSKIAAILKWLCIVLFCYVIVPFLYKQDVWQIIKQTFIPDISFTKEYLLALVGILGTTISPYLFFWQTSVEVEEITLKKTVVDKQMIHDVETDVKAGIGFSNLVFFFIILTTGTVLYKEGIHEINTVDQAARALRPLAGEGAYLLFAIGVIGTGLLAVPVLAGSLSYMISETFGWPEGLNKKFGEAPKFYIVLIVSMIVALAINFSGLSAVQALIYTAVVYGVTAPVLIALILHITNNKKIMGNETNDFRLNLAGFGALFTMIACAAMLLYFMII